MGILWLAFVACCIVFLVRLFKRHDLGRWTSSAASQSPLDIVKERYAKGEIDKQQFEQLKKDLKP